MKILGIVAQWLFILCLPVLLLTASIGVAVNSLWLYEYGFEKYNISSTTGLAAGELVKAARGLISYFNSNDEYISLFVIKNSQSFELFHQREIAHLKDVKGLIWLDYRVLLGTLIYALSYAVISLLWRRKRYWRRLAWVVVGGGSLALALTLVLGLGTLIGEEQFARFFLQFHILCFANDLWLLDPTKDYLIMLFPKGFWYDATCFCTLATAGMAVIGGGLAGGYLLFSRKGTGD